MRKVLTVGIWSETVEFAVRRLASRNADAVFSRQQLIDEELDRIVKETGSRGATPEMTLSRELQQLRDAGRITFEERGLYRLAEGPVSIPDTFPSRCVFLSGEHSIYGDQPERFYRFPSRLLKAASRSVGQWIVYQRPRRAGGPDYFAVARIEGIIRDPSQLDMYLALVEPGSYLDFGRRVPFNIDGVAVERGILTADGKVSGGHAIQSIRPIAPEDFNRILEFGLIDDGEILPREDEAQPNPEKKLKETGQNWDGPIDRATILAERKVRDRQFRARVMAAYDRRCAMTGMQLINGGGRAEAQAAHIWSVEHGGPDNVSNGIALSGTVHWMFDRGLLSISDDGDILMSRKINDVSSIEKLLYPDRKVRLPDDEAVRPDPRYLAWHREWHGIAA